jgi:hypothetical protein
MSTLPFETRLLDSAVSSDESRLNQRRILLFVSAMKTVWGLF